MRIPKMKVFKIAANNLQKPSNQKVLKKALPLVAIPVVAYVLRTQKDTIEYMLRQKAKKEAIEDLELKEDATNLDMIIASALRQAARGNTKAYEFLRDTAGEKPTEKIAAEVETITPEDRKQIERILNRDKAQDIV